MRRSSQFKGSLFTSTVVGAIGAFIFWGVFSGWFSGGEIETQLAAPAAGSQTEQSAP